MSDAGAVLVTGASRGIGHACALRLDARGFRVLAGVRRAADADALRLASSDRMRPLFLDVTDEIAVRQAAAETADALAGTPLVGIVNNAGIAVAGPLEFLPLSALREQLEINVIGQVAVTQAFLPLLRAGGDPVAARRRIVFVSSIAGRSALPFVGAYAASKHALEAVADALRVELRPWRIGVVLVEPGVVETPIWETSLDRGEQSVRAMPPAALEYYGGPLAAVSRRMRQGMRGLPADTVARVIERALTARRPKARYIVGGGARLRLLALEQLLPTRARDAVIGRAVQRITARVPRHPA